MKNNASRRGTPSTCDWKQTQRARPATGSRNKTRFSKFKGNFTWKGIRREQYKSEKHTWANISRHTLIGNHGESAKFHVRYFEIAPNGFSSFETHAHEHVVIGIRGNGVCVTGKKRYLIGFLDTLYISPNEPHQLRNYSDEPFGFLCIVNAERDKPITLDK